MPNLAKSWEWSEDGHQLTMHLIEGAKWSDGEPFTSDDVMFYWDDNIVDPNVTPADRHDRRRPSATAPRSRRSTTTRSSWTFKEAFADAVPLSDGLRQLLPQPGAHPQAQHPKYNPETTYETVQEASRRRTT